MNVCLRLFALPGLIALACPAVAAQTHPVPAATAVAARPLAVGASIPAVTLATVDGGNLSLPAAVREKPAILIFYRGSWCPYCNRHLAALAELEPQLLTLGYQILAISPDDASGLRQTSEKNQLGYRLLSDRGMAASAAFGLAFRVPEATGSAYAKRGVALAPIPGGEGFWLPVPAVYIVGRDAVIRFVHTDPDYKQRLAPEALLAAAQSAVR